MDTDFDFADIEVKETDMPPAPDICQEPGCSNPTVYGGRGPRPKKCPEHKATRTKSTRTKKKTGVDYTEAVAGLLQLPAGALAAIGAGRDKPEFLADSVVISHYAPAIATAVSDLANDRPEVAAVLDKVLKVGPYGALLAAVMPMTVQILANHKIMPAGIMGTQTAEEVLGMPARAEGRSDAG